LPGATPATAGPQPLWGVADIDEAMAEVLSLGATELEPVADVEDPFGNRLGLIQNPHFDASAVR
jgi:hypothetical protein